jgi:outer membrane protein OmpA-like peptidoglycan-associated protein
VAKKSQIELISAKVMIHMRPMNRSATMKRQILAASLAALAVFSAPVFAQDNNGDAKAEQDGAGPAVIRQVQRFLNADVDLRRLPAPELLQRYKVATELAAQDGLPEDLQAELKNAARATRNELNRRKADAGNDPAPQPTTKRRTTGAEQPIDNAAGDEPAPAPRRATGVEQPIDKAAGDEPAPAPRRATGVQDPVEQNAESPPARPRRPAVVVEQDAPAVDERAALRYLKDTRPAASLGDVELRRRLLAGRNILQAGRLGDQTKRRIARMVQADRVEVRDRQAARNQDAEKRRIQEARAKSKDKNKPRFNVDINIDLRPNTVVLRDRRRSDELTDAELQQRIQIYRDIESDRDYQSYQESERRYWREQMALDRQYMRRRLVDERSRRADEERASGREIQINVQPQASDEIDVFAAEADESQIEEVLVSAPRVRVERRYNVEEVANDANIRRSMPRVEVDTIKFGNNEAIVREEEVGKLDRIGAVLERILRGHPREVFLIEGHTDAVGSDVYNLGLSRARAEAVKVALTTYYNIPAQNLRTVGLGERFLKVPTYESEAENRRVSIGRITAYVGENR